MRIAYQRLPEEMKLRIEGLRCIHDYVFSGARLPRWMPIMPLLFLL